MISTLWVMQKKKKKLHELTEVSHADYSHKSRESKIDDVKQKGKSN